MARLSADGRRALVERNLKYAYKLAAKYRNRGVDDEDLDQVAVAAMAERAVDFDPARIPLERFGAFCHVHIVGRLKRAVAKAARRRAFEASIDADEYPAEPGWRDEAAGELDELVRAAVDLLPTLQRRIIRARFGLDGKGGCTIFEAAHRTRTSPATVIRATAGAMKMIRWALESEGWKAEQVLRLGPELYIKVS